jgi:spoIIIJ-associated protein
MTKIESPTLQGAYEEAAKQLNCSITELDVEVIQNPSKGVLGMFAKNAIIVAACKMQQKPTPQQEPKVVPIPETKLEDTSPSEKVVTETLTPVETAQEIATEQPVEDGRVVNDFFEVKEDLEATAKEVKQDILELFELSCFDIDYVDVSVYDDNTLLVVFDGKDAALLIGKEGYRYKAISYMLFNWINAKYSLQVRLEIAEFLKNQEEMVKNYLVEIKEEVYKEGRSQTKVLDGILIQIALTELRATFPDKYVAIRSKKNGDRYIIINSFYNKIK